MFRVAGRGCCEVRLQIRSSNSCEQREAKSLLSDWSEARAAAVWGSRGIVSELRDLTEEVWNLHLNALVMEFRLSSSTYFIKL